MLNNTNFHFQTRFAENALSNCTRRRLVAFDFDHTVVDDNTDIVIRDMVKSKITDEVTKLYTKSGWIPYMQEIFHLLHSDGFTIKEIKAAIEDIPEVSEIKTLFKQLHDTGNVDIIIISDSNSVFIKYWCDYNGVSNYIKHVFTNQAHFNDQGVLKVQPYHHQTECNLSSENLCKGSVLEEFCRQQQQQQNIVYDRIFYIGDGNNDICPALRLGATDFAFARIGYRMQKEIQKQNLSLDATLEIWNDGRDLNSLIFQQLS